MDVVLPWQTNNSLLLIFMIVNIYIQQGIYATIDLGK